MRHLLLLAVPLATSLLFPAAAGAQDCKIVNMCPPPPPKKPVPKPPAKSTPTPRPVRRPAPVAEVDPVPAQPRMVSQIEHPRTGNDAEDAYNYGYRLWDAQFYAEAQAQLRATAEKYAQSPVGSKARHLLGRAYLDGGKPASAAVAFYENYQKFPRGDRAPDSLALLGETLTQLKKPIDACKVYEELEDVFGTTMSSTLRSKMAKGRSAAQCI